MEKPIKIDDLGVYVIYAWYTNIRRDSGKTRWDPLQRYSFLSFGCNKVRFHGATKLCLPTPTARCMRNAFLQSNCEKKWELLLKGSAKDMWKIDRFMLSSHFLQAFSHAFSKLQSLRDLALIDLSFLGSGPCHLPQPTAPGWCHPQVQSLMNWVYVPKLVSSQTSHSTVFFNICLAISYPYSRDYHTSCQNGLENLENCKDPIEVKFGFHDVCLFLPQNFISF